MYEILLDLYIGGTINDAALKRAVDRKYINDAEYTTIINSIKK